MRYTVLINEEEQYALHPADTPLPDGWRPAGFTGDEAECVSYVDRHWSDMRPLSLRRALAEHDASPVAEDRSVTGDRAVAEDRSVAGDRAVAEDRSAGGTVLVAPEHAP